ncbi:MAG: 50S ribosomal protein L25 [Gammaproteobacteria bacterium]|nr:50S ribosomal protein L25 [Gammaproteobacteria bacterium]
MTTQAQISLEAQVRTHFGHQNKALRRNGLTPIHVYGLGEESLALQAPAHDVALTISKVGRTTPLTLTVNGEDFIVMVREIQRHPVTDTLIHVDLLRISRTEKLRVQVPIQLQSEAPAARADGMALAQDLHDAEVEALPFDMPSVIAVDISEMRQPNSVILLRDLPLPTGVLLVGDPETVVVRIMARRGISLDTEDLGSGGDGVLAPEESAVDDGQQESSDESADSSDNTSDDEPSD